MDLRKLGIPSVPMFGRYNYARAMPGLSLHRHPGAIEICYLVRGRQNYEVGGRTFHLRGGDVFLTFPGEEHSTGGEPQEKGLLYWLWVMDPRHTDDSLLGMSVRDSKSVWRKLNGLTARHFPGTPAMKTRLDAATEFANGKASPLLRVAVGNQLTGLLLDVLSAHEAATDTNAPQRFQAVLNWVHSHLTSPDELTVSRLAAISGLSTSRFKAAFKRETGVPPAEFALRARIEEAARQLARPGTDVTTVAYNLGFSSSQYFASAFRRFTNRTPSEMKPRNRSR